MKPILLRIVVPTLFALVLISLPAAAQSTITSVTPSSGPTTGGTTITIRGTNFTAVNPCPILCFPGPRLIFRRGAVTVFPSFTVVDDTTVIAVTPPFPAGPVDVIFMNYGLGTPGEPPNGFLYVTAEEIPTLGEVALMVLALALAAAAVWALRRMT